MGNVNKTVLKNLASCNQVRKLFDEICELLEKVPEENKLFLPFEEGLSPNIMKLFKAIGSVLYTEGYLKGLALSAYPITELVDDLKEREEDIQNAINSIEALTSTQN